MAMEDEPRQRLGKVLRQYSYAAPWGNSAEGELSDLPTITIDDVHSHYQSFIRPNEAILGIAGNVSVEEIRGAIEASLRKLEIRNISEVALGDLPQSPHHIEHDSTQTHIGLSRNTVPYRHERYYDAWAAVSLLSAVA